GVRAGAPHRELPLRRECLGSAGLRRDPDAAHPGRARRGLASGGARRPRRSHDRAACRVAVRFRASRFLVQLELGDGATLVGHAILGHRRILDAASAAFVALFDAPRTADEAAALARVAPKAAARLVSDLADFGWLGPDGADGEAAVGARVRARARRGPAAHDPLGAIEDEHVAPTPLALDGGEPISLLVLGMCSVQAAAPAIEAEARWRGLA